MEQKESFVFYQSFYEAIKTIPDKVQRADVYEALIDYALNDTIPELSGMAAGFFLLMKPQIDANKKRYDNGKRGSEYGNLGGRPRKKNPRTALEKPQDNPKSVFSKPQDNPDKTPNVNANANVNDNANDNENDNANENDNENENVNDNDIKPPQPPVSGETAACAAVFTELKERINLLYHRRENTQWTDKERKALKLIAKRPDVLNELTEIEDLYNSGYQYRRRDVLTFLNNFATELDRATQQRVDRENIGKIHWGKNQMKTDLSALDALT